jgi:hypothetical protein
MKSGNVFITVDPGAPVRAGSAADARRANPITPSARMENVNKDAHVIFFIIL